jgi:hypothetical protein
LSVCVRPWLNQGVGKRTHARVAIAYLQMSFESYKYNCVQGVTLTCPLVREQNLVFASRHCPEGNACVRIFSVNCV